MMDDITSSISEDQVLPTLTPDIQDAIVELLLAIGVETKADLTLVEESNWKQCLTPIQTRKMFVDRKPNGAYKLNIYSRK